jgi:hypothetical protein
MRKKRHGDERSGTGAARSGHAAWHSAWHAMSRTISRKFDELQARCIGQRGT